MRTRQQIIWPPDDRLANLLRPAAKSEGWTLCTPRGEAACLRFARRGGRSVLLLGLGAGSDREMPFLERISHRHVRTDVVVIAPSSTTSLAPLAWRLGAAMVLTDPWSVHEIVGITAGLLGEKPLPAEPKTAS